MIFLELVAAAALGGLLTTAGVVYFMGRMVKSTVHRATETLADDARREEMFGKMADERARLQAERANAGNLPTTLEELDYAIARQQTASHAESIILAELMAQTPGVAHAAGIGTTPALQTRDELLLFSWMPPLAPNQVKYYSDRVRMIGAVKRGDKVVWLHREVQKVVGDAAKGQPEPGEDAPEPENRV